MEKRKSVAKLTFYLGGDYWAEGNPAQVVEVMREPDGTFTLECSGKRLESIWDRKTVPETLPNALRYAAEIVLGTASHILQAEQEGEGQAVTS